MITLTPGTVLAPLEESNPTSKIREACRILAVDRSADAAVVIPVEPKRYTDKKGTDSRLFFRAPRKSKIRLIEADLLASPPLLRQVPVTARRINLLTDEEIVKRFPSKVEEAGSSLIRVRDQKWGLISDLVQTEDLVDLLDVEVRDKKILNHIKIALDVETCNVERTCAAILRALFQYRAQGSTKNGLTPFYHNCGNKGHKRKRGTKKLGRPNAPTQAGIKGHEGYVLNGDDADYIAHSWHHFLIRGVTIAAACRRMWREFYSTLKTDDTGRLRPVLVPPNERPTLRQFSYQGTILSEETASSKQARPNEFEHIGRALIGSANDGICAVGQRAAIDATTNDTELVSLVSRLDRIGTANRILVADSLFGYIPGFYLGLSPESSATIQLAMLHAMTDKTEWLEALGIEHECPAEDWIPIQFADLLGDNTGLRAEQIHKTFLDTNIARSAQYVPRHRSDQNSIVETRHLSLHRLFDHKLPGTTRGKRTERGERRPTEGARLTLIENVRDTAKAVYLHNTIILTDFQLTLEMKRDGVKPTRLDLTRWAIEKGQIAGHLIDIADARARILPVWQGVFTESGVWLIRSDSGEEKTRISSLRYRSSHPVIIQNIELARSKGTQYANFRVDPYAIRKIWFLDPGSLESIQLKLKTNDKDLVHEATLMDVERMEIAEQTDRFFNEQLRQEQLSNFEGQIEETNAQAKEEYKQEENSTGKLTKKAMSANKSANRERENSILYEGMPVFGGEDQDSADKDVGDGREIEEGLLSPEDTEKTNIFSLAYEGVEDE